MYNPVSIHKQGNLLSIKLEPRVLAGLARVLCVETHCASESCRFGSTIEAKTVPLWQPKYPKASIWDEPIEKPEFPPEITVLAGLEGLVVSALNEMSVPFTLTESRPTSQPELLEGQRDFKDSMKFIRDHERGIIRFGRSQKTLNRLAITVIKSFPNARILLTTHYRKDAQMLRRNLRKAGVCTGFVFDNYDTVHEESPRVVIANFGGIGSGLVDGKNIDIALVLHPSYLANNQYFYEVLRELSVAKLFGLQVAGLELTEEQEMQMESVFGYLQRRAELDRRSVRCKFIELPGLNPRGIGRNAFETHRSFYETHSSRNRQICRFADSISSGKNAGRHGIGQHSPDTRVAVV